MTTISRDELIDATIDGQQVREITVGGDVVWTNSIVAQGGSTVVERTINGTEYRIHAFENVGSATFTVESVPTGGTIDLLMVAGGGGGGGNRGGGGGAGEVYMEMGFPVTAKEYALYVGDGGIGGENDFGENGENTQFGDYTVKGGGTGAPQYNPDPGKDGGSGGGGGTDGNTNAGNAIPNIGLGNDGGDGKTNYSNVGSAGGGGGADSAGVSPDGVDGTLYRAPVGGRGKDYSNIFTTQFGLNGTFGGGGAGGTEGYIDATNNTDYTRVRGFDGGGDSGLIEHTPSAPTTYTSDSQYNQEDGEDGVSNTGGGGGGAGFSDTRVTRGGDGGSGVVIIRYEI